MRHRPGWAALGAAVALVATAGAAPAQAQDVPAWGSITITDNGIRGIVATNTYEDADRLVWDCETTTHSGVGGAVDRVTVTCLPNPQAATFACPEMVLSVATRGGTAGGQASCNAARTLDSGVMSGFAVSQPLAADLGRVTAITCVAYVNYGALVPPYSVTCAEPGASRP
ncbi:MAG TPA: hypothetical protein VFQ85_08570 [Mycobacteriales bacterium]|jgi:hypothetical protein|nr:hypothetical protein [Mycobacteriales bacterium]